MRKILAIAMMVIITCGVSGFLQSVPYCNLCNFTRWESGSEHWNDNNSCYMNAVFQAFFHTKPLTRAMLKLSELDVKKLCEAVTKKEDAELLREFIALIKQRGQACASVCISKQELYEKFTQYKRSFTAGSVQDAHDFFTACLAFLPHDFLQFFQYVVAEKKLCDSCPYSSEECKTESFLLITIHDLFSGVKYANLAESIENYFSKKSDDLGFDETNWRLCGACKNKSRYRITQTSVKTSPQILCLQLGRFSFDASSGDTVKILEKFPFELTIKLPGLDDTYALYAIVMHKGKAANDGHYYTFARDYEEVDEKIAWRLYDDLHPEYAKISAWDAIQRISVDGLDKENATPYLLFYEKASGKEAGVNGVSDGEAGEVGYFSGVKNFLKDYTPDVVKRALRRLKHMVGVEA